MSLEYRAETEVLLPLVSRLTVPLSAWLVSFKQVVFGKLGAPLPAQFWSRKRNDDVFHVVDVHFYTIAAQHNEDPRSKRLCSPSVCGPTVHLIRDLKGNEDKV